jgi:hypothetical protein
MEYFSLGAACKGAAHSMVRFVRVDRLQGGLGIRRDDAAVNGSRTSTYF